MVFQHELPLYDLLSRNTTGVQSYTRKDEINLERKLNSQQFLEENVDLSAKKMYYFCLEKLKQNDYSLEPSQNEI